jgi:epoxyqueuosine reductase
VAIAMLTPEAIKERARDLGFDLCGIAAAGAFPELGRLSGWLRSGYAGDMTYLERSADVRRDIQGFLPSARSVILTATIYETSDASPSHEPAGVARIAR